MPVVGSAEIVVTALTAGFKQQIKQALRESRPEAAKEGERYGKAFGNKFRIQLKNDVRKAFRENRDWVKQEGGRQGKLFGAEFAKSFSTEFQARAPGMFQKALGDPGSLGEDFGKKFADAMKRGAKQGGTITAEDVIAPGAAPRQPRGGAPEQLPAAAEDQIGGARARLAAAKAAFEEIQALAKAHEDALLRIQQLAADDELNLERAKLTNLAADQDRQAALDEDRLSEHLAKVLYAATTEEDIAQHLADFSADRQKEAQANLDATIAKMKEAAAEVRAAQVQRGGPSAARKALIQAQKEYADLQDTYDRAAIDAASTDRVAIERAKDTALALEAIKDRELELDKARQQKKSTVAAQQAIADARTAFDAAFKQQQAADQMSKTSSARKIADAEALAEALQRLAQAEQPIGARLNILSIKNAEKAHEELKKLADEAEQERDAANARQIAAYQDLTEKEYELARRRDELIAASSKKQRAQAQQEYDRALAEAKTAAAEARAAGEEADVTRVRHERIVVDVDRSKARIDLFREGKDAGLSFMRGMTPEFANAAKKAHAQWSHFYRLGMAVGPAIALGVGAVASLGSGLVSLAASASQAAGALVVLPGLIGALGQAAITAVVAFKGVGQAIGAGFKAADAATEGAGKTTLAQARAIEDARQSLSRAYEDNARRMRDANRRVVDAEEDLAEAQNASRIAQNALTGARRRALETLEDLQFGLEGAVLSEERAVLRLQQATEELARTRADPSATAQELQEASLNYREAELALRMAQDALEDVEEEQAAAAAAGVEGSAEVVEAQNDIIDANNRVADSQEALARAEEDRGDTSVQNARAIADAQERLTEALEDQQNASGGAKAAADAYAAALEKLSPPARAFVEYAVSLKDRFKELRDAAGSELFGPLKLSLENIVTNFFPALRIALQNTGAALGDFATSISDVLSSSQFVARFTQIAEDNTTTIQRFGDIIASVIDGISGVLVAAGPLIDRFTSFLSDKAEDFQKFATSGEGIADMARFFEHAGDTAAKFGEIIGNVISAFGGLMSAADESGQTMLDRLIGISEKFEEFVTSIEGHNELQDYFNTAGENASEVLGLIWDIVKALAGLGAQSGIGEAARTLRAEWVPVLEEILATFSEAGGALADLVVEVTKIVRAFADTGSIEVFLGILSSVAGIIADIVASDIGQFFVDAIGPIAAAASAIGLVVSTVGTVGQILAGAMLSVSGFISGIAGLWSAVGTVFAQAWTSITLVTVEMKSAWAATIALRGGALTLGTGLAAAGAAARTLGAALLTLLANPVVALVAALTAGIAIFMSWKNAQREAEQTTKEFSETLNQQTGAITAATLEKYIDELDSDLIPALQDAGIGVQEMMTALTGSEDDWDAFVSKALAAGVNLSGFAGSTKGLMDLQEDFQNQIGKSQAALETSNAVQEVANELTKESSAAMADQKIAAMSIEEQNKFVTDGLKKMNEQYENLVDNYTNLNDKAITSERTIIRIEEANDKLAGSFNDVIEATKAQIDESGKLIRAQEDLIKVGEDGRDQLDLSTESGRIAATQIMDYISLLDEQMQANIDNKMSLEEATTTYDKQKEAFIQSAKEAGISEEAVRKYIAQIELTPSEKKTRFIAVMEEAAVTKMITDISDLGLQARVIEMVGQLDHDPTLADIMAIKAQLETELPGLQFPVTVDAQTVETTKSTLASMLVDDDGNPLTAEVLLEANAPSYKALREQLVAFSKKLGIPVAPEVMDPELKAAAKKMADLLVDPRTKKPRTVEMMPKVDQEKYAAAEEEFKTLSRQRAALMSPETRASEITRVKGELDALMAPRTTPLSVDDKNAIATKKAELAALEDPLVADLAVHTRFYDDQGKPLEGALAAVGQVRRRAEGGPIIGPGGPKADKVGPFMLSSGEFVLSAKAVQALGGMSSTTALHKALKSGIKPPRMAAGGIVPPRSGGTLTMLAEKGRPERVEPLDANGLSAGDRAILAELRRLQTSGMAVNIGTIVSPGPTETAREVVSELRSEAYRLGQYR